MAPLPAQQKAIIFNTKTNTLSLTSSAPLPHAPDNLLIKVDSTAITNGELTWGPFVNWPTEHIPCYDISGFIISLPTSHPSGHGFKEGDRVYGRIAASREGSARQYTTLLLSEAALVPKVLGMVEASTVPMSACTAWQALFEHGVLTGSFTPISVPHITEAGEPMLGQAKGKRVLILGAAGGVGSMAVQFAKLAGAYVVGTASARNAAFLKEMGVDEALDYRNMSVKQFVEAGRARFDLVLDCVGGDAMLDGWNGIKRDGAYISIVPGFREPESGNAVVGARSLFFIMQPRGDELARIGKFFDKGMLKAMVDSVWELEQFQDAFKRSSSGHARGKVVFQVGGKK